MENNFAAPLVVTGFGECPIGPVAPTWLQFTKGSQSEKG